MTTRSCSSLHRFLRRVTALGLIAGAVVGCGGPQGDGTAEMAGASLVTARPRRAPSAAREPGSLRRTAAGERDGGSPVDIETSLPPGGDLVLPVDDAVVQVSFTSRDDDEIEIEPVLMWRHADGEQQEVLERTTLGRGRDRVVEIDLDRPYDTSREAARVDVWIRVWRAGRGEELRGGSVFFRHDGADEIRAYDEQGRRQRHRDDDGDTEDPGEASAA